MHLLDTNVCIGLLNGKTQRLTEKLAAEPAGNVALCSVVKAELLFGARRSTHVEANLLLLQRFFAPFTSLPFDDRAADEYGLIRSDLSRQGTPIGPNDLLIAAIARANDAILVTRNVAEFSRVPGLRMTNWE